MKNGKFKRLWILGLFFLILGSVLIYSSFWLGRPEFSIGNVSIISAYLAFLFLIGGAVNIFYSIFDQVSNIASDFPFTDFPSLVSLIFIIIILGIGYAGIWFLAKLRKKDFYHKPIFDKTIQSLVLGTWGFLISSVVFKVPSDVLVDTSKLFSWLLATPFFILVDLAIIEWTIIAIAFIEDKLEEQNFL